MNNNNYNIIENLFFILFIIQKDINNQQIL